MAAGRIGTAVLRRLKPFDVKLHYTDRHRLPEQVERELNLTWHPDVESMVSVCDVVTINCPLHPETEHLFNAKMLAKMKRGAYIINTARGKICDRDAIVSALESGQVAGYAGDVWFPQPAPSDHPWRTMPHQGMTPHTSGTTLSAQARYAAGTREILECWFSGKPIDPGYFIKRAEIWGNMKRWIKAGAAIDPKDEDLYQDLIGPETVPRLDGKIQLESKEDMKDRGLPSPNKGDALALTFSQPVAKKIHRAIGKGGLRQEGETYLLRGDAENELGQTAAATADWQKAAGYPSAKTMAEQRLKAVKSGVKVHSGKKK